MGNYTHLLEEVDAAVFSGALLVTDLEEFKEYLHRWDKEVKAHSTVIPIELDGVTLSEYLKVKDNQKYVLNEITSELRKRGEWGRYGLNAKLGVATGFNSSYIGQMLLGNKPITEAFLEKVRAYLEGSK